MPYACFYSTRPLASKPGGVGPCDSCCKIPIAPAKRSGGRLPGIQSRFASLSALLSSDTVDSTGVLRRRFPTPALLWTFRQTIRPPIEPDTGRSNDRQAAAEMHFEHF